jgi:hypothetical protein
VEKGTGTTTVENVTEFNLRACMPKHRSASTRKLASGGGETIDRTSAPQRKTTGLTTSLGHFRESAGVFYSLGCLGATKPNEIKGPESIFNNKEILTSNPFDFVASKLAL